ncbi:MAG: EAL domain-containing protein, partial [Planctomycetes bacterium]|nr:EAL domain-containing protein [Planctomycetota bacterium]
QRILQHRSSHDDLTDLPNRTLAIDRLQQAMARSSRGETHVLVMFVDLDHFKSINDTLGHVVGDKLLAWFARQIQGVLRPADTAARLGGDEFILICEGLAADRDAAEVEMNNLAERVKFAISQQFECDGSSVSITASIGMRLVTGRGHDAENILREADAAMYQAKRGGRSRAHLYDGAVRAEAMQRLQIQSSLRDGLDRCEFSVAYQPIVSLPDGAVIGAEALARWQHPEHGPISPERFIRVAEDCGLIVKLGEQILARVCDDIAAHPAWRQAGLRISVNVSAGQLTQSDFVATFRRNLKRCGIEPSQIAVELTESVLTNAVGSSARQLNELRAMGSAVGIDDFGTGYSSLAYLRRLPISFVKLDRSFVAGVGSNSADRDILRAIVSLAKALKLDVIAEGVERQDQIKPLMHMGCQTAQGFYFGRPEGAAAIDAALAGARPSRLDSGPSSQAAQT